MTAAEPPTLRAVWNVLVEECGARDDDSMWRQFQHAWPKCLEFRFQGSLGFGGKIYAGRPPRVDMYIEDRTPGRVEAARRANERLAVLFAGQVTVLP